MRIYGEWLDQLSEERIEYFIAKTERDYELAKKNNDWELCRTYSYWNSVLKARR